VQLSRAGLRTIITTDIWQRRNGAWKQIATHASLVKE
jgi:hypothetical protein